MENKRLEENDNEKSKNLRRIKKTSEWKWNKRGQKNLKNMNEEKK